MKTPDEFAAARKSVWWFLLLGLVVRLVALNQPLVTAHLFRQGQTALMTRGMMEQPGLPLGAVATWRGDYPALLVQELPVYNYLMMPVCKVVGRVDVAGKLVSVALWGFSFWLLQGIWRRCLTSRQAFWANLIFVFAPLSIFFGQAVMPEMVIQSLAFGFLLALMRYREKPGTGRFLTAAGLGLLGMLVKAPEILHLYPVAIFFLLKTEGVRGLRNPLYWAVFILSMVAVKCWGMVIDASNVRYFPGWTSAHHLVNFIGAPWKHVEPIGYIRILLYVTCFILTPVGLPLALAGAWRLVRSRSWDFPMWWFVSVLFFFFFWSGPVARNQSYYNLPALGVCAMLFGFGVDWLLSRWPASAVMCRRVAFALILMLAPFCAAANLYLFRPDRVVLQSTQWIKEHSDPKDLILLKANHREDAVYYTALATFPFYAERRFWVYAPDVAPEEKKRALETSKYALVTLRPAQESKVDQWRRRVTQKKIVTDDITPVLEQAGFQMIYSNVNFLVYSNQPVTLPQNAEGNR